MTMPFPAFRHVYIFCRLKGIPCIKCKDLDFYLIIKSIIGSSINNVALCYLWILHDIFVA